MSIPIIGDHKQPQLTKTEKAVEMLERQNLMLQDWCQGLQRQLAGLMIHLNLDPGVFVQNTRKVEEINSFLKQAGDVETKIMETEKDEKLKNIEEFKENGNIETKKSS